jgi:hypothetical protein
MTPTESTILDAGTAVKPLPPAGPAGCAMRQRALPAASEASEALQVTSFVSRHLAMIPRLREKDPAGAWCQAAPPRARASPCARSVTAWHNVRTITCKVASAMPKSTGGTPSGGMRAERRSPRSENFLVRSSTAVRSAVSTPASAAWSFWGVAIGPAIATPAQVAFASSGRKGEPEAMVTAALRGSPN